MATIKRTSLAVDNAMQMSCKFSGLPSYPTTKNLTVLAAQIEDQRRVIDSGLHYPARWLGLMRREVHGHCKPGENLRYIEAYNVLIAEAASANNWQLDLALFRKIHHLAVGGEDFRSSGLRVGDHHDFPAPSRLESLILGVLQRAADNKEAPTIVAARIHLNVLAIHPFLDGNGRTGRLAATLWLVRAGYRCGLFLATEQHFHRHPRYYIQILDKFQYKQIDEDTCVALLLQNMIAHSMYAVWFRVREHRLRKLCANLGIPEAQWTQTMIDFDLGTAGSLGSPLAVQTNEYPLKKYLDFMTSVEHNELIFQMIRLLDEEAKNDWPNLDM